MEIDNISDHLKKLSNNEWEKLFALIPQIELIKEFSKGGDVIEDKNDHDSYIIIPEIEDPIVLKFLDIMEELDLIIPFSWSKWDYGKAIYEKGEYSNLDTITLLKLLTAFIRADHFSYGAGLASRFEDRTIGKILIELKNNILKSSYPKN